MGDLEDATIADDVARNLTLYRGLYEFDPAVIAIDRHPDYLSSQQGRELAQEEKLNVVEVQHHHAHIAACLAENGRPLAAAPVLGIAIDGLGLGDDGTLWGGEFLVADYLAYTRAGHLKPVALPGGAAAIREPWRNAYAHLRAEMSWAELSMNFAGLPLFGLLGRLPRDTLDAMIRSGMNAPLSSSGGRLFDAAAAIAGLAWSAQGYEGEAAMRFEAVIDRRALDESEDYIYPFTLPLMGGRGLPYIEPVWMWRAMLGDLHLGTPLGVIAARFHRGLARAVVQMAARITDKHQLDTVALTGGCFQNATLFRLVHAGLAQRGLKVLSHAQVPANDGGLALGQAVVALATLQKRGGSHVSWHTRSGH
jgi:hydrogenase maturation protein HypF